MGIVEKRKHQGSHGDSQTKRKRKANLPKDINTWSVHNVNDWLKEEGFSETIACGFIDECIDGQKLAKINEETVDDINVNFESTEEKNKLMEALDKLRDENTTTATPTLQRTPTKYLPEGEETKVLNDPIHGHIEMHPLCMKIIDTPQFQRLRYLKQLGACYFVYPGASHNRFEHCIGVSHLAGELVRVLHKRQPQLQINDKDMLCVEIAGLCHDLGHGPFSHMWDGKFIPAANPRRSTWKHEQASVDMFQHMIDSNDLTKEFNKFGLYDRDFTFIKEQIAGVKRANDKKEWPYEGRSQSKSFLYEIVANKRNGIDVDKWDYFARDCHHLGIKNNFDHTRFMKFVRVIEVDNEKQICSRDKEVDDIYDMFGTRARLHRFAYQHKTNQIIEKMLCEAFALADQHLKYTGKDGRRLCLSETIDDMEAYTRVTDHVFHQILLSTEEGLEPARKLLQRIENRELYKCVGQTKPKVIINQGEVKEADIVNSLDKSQLGSEQLHANDIVVLIVNIDYGKWDKNPIDDVRFYKKSKPESAIKVRKDEVSSLLPSKFLDQTVRIYCKKTDSRSRDVAERCFKKWCEQNSTLVDGPKGGELEKLELTPCKTSTSTSADGNNVRRPLNFRKE